MKTRYNGTNAMRPITANGSHDNHQVVMQSQMQVLPTVLSPKEALSSDPIGQGYYVIAVFLVYGMSIVLLIASHIRRKHSKLATDREIRKYLQEFQIVKETSNRDSYRNLKRSVIAKLSRARLSTQRGVARSSIPMITVSEPRKAPSDPEYEYDVDGDDEDDQTEVEEYRNDSYGKHINRYSMVRTGEGLKTMQQCSEGNRYHGNKDLDAKHRKHTNMYLSPYTGDRKLESESPGNVEIWTAAKRDLDGKCYGIDHIPEATGQEKQKKENGCFSDRDKETPEARCSEEQEAKSLDVVEVQRLRQRDYMDEVSLDDRSNDPRWILLTLLLENRMRWEENPTMPEEFNESEIVGEKEQLREELDVEQESEEEQCEEETTDTEDDNIKLYVL